MMTRTCPPRGPGRQAQPRSRTQIVGVGFAEITIGSRKVPHFVASYGRRSKSFNIRRLGRQEAFRRALKRRAEYEILWKEKRAA